MFLLEFFRDVLSGFLYYVYVVACIFAMFYVLGIVADRKREMIEKKLREKKQYDIESGREAAIAAMETKQVLDVDDTPDPTLQVQGAQDAGISMQLQDVNKKEEVPSVMVLDSSTMNQAPAQNPAMGQPMASQMTQQQLMQPLVQQAVPGQMPGQPMGAPMQGQPAQAQPVAQQPLVINSK